MSGGETLGKPLDINRVIVAFHHEYERVANDCREELEANTAYDVVLLKSEKGGWEPNGQALESIVRENDAIGVVGGDGTFNDFGAPLVYNPELAKMASITSLQQGGNACDGGRALHGWMRHRPSQIFGGRAREVQGYAINCVIDTGQEVYNEVALSYLGVGQVAKFSAELGTDHYKKGTRIIRDIDLVMRGLRDNYTFEAVTDKGTQPLRTIEFHTGSAVAKLGTVRVKHWEEAFWVNPVQANSLPAALRMTAGLALGYGGGFKTTEPYEFRVNDTVPLHVDGDFMPRAVPAGSQIAVGLLTDNPYRLITTRL